MEQNMTQAQIGRIHTLWENYHTPEEKRQLTSFGPAFDLPDKWVEGWIFRADGTKAIFVGISPEGESHS